MNPLRIRPQSRTRTPVGTPEADAPAQWHRVLTLLATVSLFIGTRSLWTQAASHQLVIAAVVSLCYLSIMVTGALALTVRRTRTLARLDLCVLITAVTLTVCTLALNHAGGDEGVLTTQAARELAAGHPVYGQPWPWLFQHNSGVTLTPTMNGGYDFTYGYPPLVPLLTAPLLWLGHGALAATVVTTGALLVAAVTLWLLLPVPWRSAATMVCLGFGFLPSYARLGYPAIVGLALLIPVVVHWPRIGAGGRLGRGGLARAACLGAACAAQQLPWFLVPFLLAGIYAVRRGELGARPAAWVVLRITGAAATVWLLINTYFIVSEPRTWATGVALPLTQDATIHGQGLVGVALYFTDGSDRLAWYSHASMLLTGALLALLVVFVRRLGPATVVLPWCAFFLATRSQDGYYLMMTPLWLAAAVTTPAASFARAWQPRPRFLAGPRRRPALVATGALLLVPALVCTAVAATGSPPLRLRVTRTLTSGPAGVSELSVRVTNGDDSALTPHFTLTTGQGMTRWWTVVQGPATLPAHTSAVYRIQPPERVFPVPKRPGTRIRLRVFTASPDTLSSVDLRLPGGSAVKRVP